MRPTPEELEEAKEFYRDEEDAFNLLARAVEQDPSFIDRVFALGKMSAGFVPHEWDDLIYSIWAFGTDQIDEAKPNAHRLFRIPNEERHDQFKAWWFIDWLEGNKRGIFEYGNIYIAINETTLDFERFGQKRNFKIWKLV